MKRFIFSVEIDDETFEGSGPSKKLAKQAQVPLIEDSREPLVSEEIAFGGLSDFYNAEAGDGHVRELPFPDPFRDSRLLRSQFRAAARVVSKALIAHLTHQD